MAKGVSCLLPHHYTFHIGLALLNVLTELLFFLVPTVPGHPDNPSPDSTAHRSTLSTAASIATQLSSSGLLQQLPAMLQRGQQQLSALDAFGYCGVPECRYCSRDRNTTSGMGLTNAALNPVQAHLLDFCSQVINMWPGGALSSAAVGPLLVPAAELALGSLQTATRLVQARPDSSIVPSDGMRQLGSAAFNMCFTLCSAAADLDSTPHSSNSNSGRLPRFAQQLLEDPVMLPVAVVLGSSAVYREHLLLSIESAKTRNGDMADCSTDTTTSSGGSSNSSGDGAGYLTGRTSIPAGEDICIWRQLDAVMFQVVPVGVDAEVPAAAWQLLTAQERQLSAGQSLLPELQQQLLSTLGCNAKAFLWLSAAADPNCYSWQDYKSMVLLNTVSEAVHLSCTAKLLESQQQIQPSELQQLLLLPALLLRWAVHKQQQEGRQLAGMYCTVNTAIALIKMSLRWRDLVAKAAKQQEQPQQLQMLLQEWHSRQGQSGGTQMPAAVLHELLLLLTHQMQWAFEAKPDFSSLVAAGHAQEEFAARSPEGAADHVAAAIALLLPAATRAVTRVEVSIGAGSNSSRVGGSGGSSSSSSTAGSSSSIPGTRTASAEVDWVGLLLRMLPTLERSIRFQAQHSPKEDLVGLGEFYQRHPGGPTWICAFFLASCVGHAEVRTERSLTQSLHGSQGRPCFSWKTQPHALVCCSGC